MRATLRVAQFAFQQLFNNGEALGSYAVSGLNGNGVHAGSHLLGVDGEAFCVYVVVLVNNLTHHVDNDNLLDSSVSNDVGNGGSGVGEYVAGHVGANFVDAYVGSSEVLGLSSVVDVAVSRIAGVVVAYEGNEAGAPSLEASRHGPGVGLGVVVASVGGGDSVAIESAEGSTVNVVVLVAGRTAALGSDDAVFNEVERYASTGQFKAEGTGNGSGEGAGCFVKVHVSDVAGNESRNVEGLVDASSNVSVGEEYGALLVAEAEVGAVEHDSGSIGTAINSAIVEPFQSYVILSSHNIGIVASVVAHPDYVRTGSESCMDAVMATRAVGALSGSEVFKERGAGNSCAGIVSDTAGGSLVVGSVEISLAVRIGDGYNNIDSTGSSHVKGSGEGEVIRATGGNIDTGYGLNNGGAAVYGILHIEASERLAAIVDDGAGNVSVGVDGEHAGDGDRGKLDLVGNGRIDAELVNAHDPLVSGIGYEGEVDGLACISCEAGVDPAVLGGTYTKLMAEEESVGKVSHVGTGGRNIDGENLGVGSATTCSHEFNDVVGVGNSNSGGDEPAVNGTAGSGLGDTSCAFAASAEVYYSPSIAKIVDVGVVGESIVFDGSPTGRESANASIACVHIVEILVENRLLSRCSKSHAENY